MLDGQDPSPRVAHAILRVRRKSTGLMVPVVVVGGERTAGSIALDALGCVLALQDEGASPQALDRVARVYGLMADFHAVELRQPVMTEADLRAFLGRFLKARYRGLQPTSEGDEEVGLRWRPIRWGTMKADMAAALRFFRYCVDLLGHYPAFVDRGPSLRPEFPGRVLNQLRQGKRDFLSHLADKRQGTGRAAAVVPIPGHSRPPARPRGVNGSDYFPASHVEDFIRATPNLVRRMIWILAAYGGPRLSEQLNLWIDDVLPGTLRPRLFPDSPATAECLVVLAEPAESTYTGSLPEASASRLQHLHARNLKPRKLLDRRDGMFAGWKGVVPENDARVIAQIFWLSPTWAAEYYRLYAQLLDLRAASSRARSHPWLYVNVGRDRDAGTRYGDPMRMSNVRKGFEADCARVGLTPYKGGASIHRLRGLYRRMALDAGFSELDLQRMMHHASVGGQDPYGRPSASDVHSAIGRAAIGTASRT